MSRYPVTLVAAFLLALEPAVALQRQTFRGAVDTVPVYATVTDARGALVPNLKIGDFRIEEDGRGRPVTVFQSGAKPMAIAMLIDRSPSLFDAASRIHAAVTEFVGQLLPEDRACLGSFSHVVSLVPTLVTDHDALIRHLGDDVPYPAGTALWDAIEAGRAAVSPGVNRRVVLLFTDAADNASTSDIDAVRSRLEEDGTLLYAIGLRGREGLHTLELAAITRATGGWYLELRPTDDLSDAMRRIADELHRQYVLGFSPHVLDGKSHHIDVKVTRPGMTVRARRSYVAG